MELAVISDQDKAGSAGSMDVSDAVFAAKFNEPLVHQVVTAYMAGARAGTRAQKSRSDVRGGGRKPWRQKGTGRARAGTRNSPIWRGGGVTFAAKPADHSQKVNRKMYRAAMRSILSELLRQERLLCIERIEMEKPKTALAVKMLRALGLEQVLVVTEEPDINLLLATRNLPHVQVADEDELNPYDLLKHEKVLMTRQALENVEERLR